MPVLVGISIDYKGKTFPLEEDEVSVGRGDENAITLNNSSISYAHCKLVRNGTTYSLQDLDSTNGTRVNGQAVKDVKLQDRDVVHFGALEFIFADQQPENVDVEALTTQEIMPQVEVSDEAARSPDSFHSVSPFKQQRKNKRGNFYMMVSVIGAVALALVAFLFFRLFAG